MIAGGSKCVFAGGYNGECGGQIRWHHPVKQQRLKRQFPLGAWRWPGQDVWKAISRFGVDYPEDPDIQIRLLPQILGDTRNRVWICDTHHERLHNGRFYIDELPDSVWEFARSFGLDAQLENDLARRAA